MSDNIDKLRQLTEKLIPLSTKSVRKGFKEYNVNDGTSLGFALYKDPEIAVQRIFISAGSKPLPHNHKEKEYITVYRGKLRVTIDGKDRICKVGDSVYFNPMQMHHESILEDTWLLCVTIPACEEYPEDG